MTTQDPELSAALGWPGGISDPVLDRTRLLQIVAALRLTSKQALEALTAHADLLGTMYLKMDAITALRAVLAQQAESVEPVEPVAWDVTKDGRLIYDYDFTHDVSLRVMGDFEDDEQRVRYAKQIVDKLNAAPPQRTMVLLTEEEIFKIENDIPDDVISDRAWTICLTRAVEKAVWEKNHGQA